MSPAREEMAAFNCKDSRVFVNSDLFLKSKGTRFVGEYKLKDNKIKFSKKVLEKLVKNSKEVRKGQVKNGHTPYLLFEKKYYALSVKQFSSIKEGISVLLKNSTPYGGVLIKKDSVTKYVNRKNKGMIPIQDMRCSSFCSYKGLHWEMF